MDTLNQQPNNVPNQVRLVDVQVTDENIALNLIVSFVTLAHKRGSIFRAFLEAICYGTRGCFEALKNA